MPQLTHGLVLSEDEVAAIPTLIPRSISGLEHQRSQIGHDGWMGRMERLEGCLFIFKIFQVTAVVMLCSHLERGGGREGRGREGWLMREKGVMSGERRRGNGNGWGGCERKKG